MTDSEAIEYETRMTPEQRIKMLREHWQLKQLICAQTLGVATGADDWLERSVMRAEQLRECEHVLRKLIYGTSELIEEAQWRSKFRTCTNCMGRKTTGDGHSCVICKGTGRRAL